MPESLTPQEMELGRILANPVLFAKHFLGIELRDYQKEMLLFPAKRKVFRCGRRVGKTTVMVIHMIWMAFTRKNANLLWLNPFDDQVNETFEDHVRKYMSYNPIFKECIVIDRREPQEIKFSNGSRILGRTVGTKSGGEGASQRGKRADWMYLDEVDYMTDADIKAILGISLEDQERIGIWAASTPTGKRSTFYRWCMNARSGKQVKPGIWQGDRWTEFHFPSTVLPTWNPELENAWREELGELGFLQEVMAEFGDESVGVYPKEHIDRALGVNVQRATGRPYRYYEFGQPVPPLIRVIGVDWDLVQATPEIAVLEYDPSLVNEAGQSGGFRVCYRESIARSEFILDDAVKRIVELNGWLQPAWIYVDRGYGDYQVERLKILGKQAKGPHDPAYGLDHKVIGIQFRENRIVRDPVTGREEEKEAKPFMVMATRTLLGRDQLWLSQEDKRLIKQMENFRVEKVTETGRPRYTSTNEHALDALHLCVLAFCERYPELTQVIEPFRHSYGILLAKGIAPPRATERHGPPLTVPPPPEVEYVSPGLKQHQEPTWIKVHDLRTYRRAGVYVDPLFPTLPSRSPHKGPWRRPKF